MWTEHSQGAFDPARAVSFGNGLFVSVGGKFISGQDRGIIESSADGITWSNRVEIGVTDLARVTYQNGTLLAVGGFYGGGTIITSTDGVNWSQRLVSDFTRLYGIAFGQHTFIVVGESGLILQSGDLRVPWLSGQRRMEGFELTMTGEIGRTYQIETTQATSPFSGWTDWVRLMPTQSVTRLVDATATNLPQRFYRAVSP